MMEARTNYAEHHGLTIEQVTEEMIKGSEKGPVHWATVKTNVSARSATGQAFQRALKHRPDVRELYQVLLDSEKIAFRQAWSCTKSFEFTTARRSTTNTFRRRKEDVGVFKTELQLQQLLGGADKAEAVSQASNYVNMCIRPDLKPFCYMYNDWLKADTYLWVESLVSTASETAWMNEVTVESENPLSGSWSEKAEFCKAVRVYAVEYQCAPKDVTLEMLQQTTLGVKGFAKLYESTPAAFPQPGGDGSASNNKQTAANPPAPAAPKAKPAAKGKAKAMKTGDGAQGPDGENPLLGSGGDGDEGQGASKRPKKGAGNPTGKKEREVKEFLALEAESDNVMSKIASSMSANPAVWSWAKDFVQQYRSLRTEILAMYADVEFFGQMKIAALSAKETSRLKKIYGLDYHSKLCEFCLQMGPKIAMMSECTSKIRSMSDAQAEAAAGTPSKASTKSKKKEVIVPDDETQRRLHSLLRYSKNGRGRCLKAAFPPLGLRRGHRLEPSEHLLDVDNFIHLTTPFSCIFYTGGTHGRILHRSPFLRIPGVSIDCWCIDVLHTWHFGPLSSYVAHSLRTLISSPVYQPASYKDLEKEEADKLALLHLRAELWSFYKRRRESDEDWKRKGSEVWNLTLTMIAGKYLKAKAAETHGLLNFVVDRLAKHSEQLASTTEAASVDLLLRAGTAAMDFDAVLAAHPRAVDADTCALLFDNYNRFICLAARAQIPLMPKCHMMYHMIQRALLKGNPRFYSTYIDESLNGAIARVCRSVHRRGWALAVYRKLSMLEQLLAEDED
ncbi:unnamed protein product [Symbiodinium sp. CCMP2592]|nr:unnamed protein product [Symbiodinium sp. CCMP2592]CAE7671772.1 unnamed protein product [Symbiodinium sp. CCMP2592]